MTGFLVFQFACDVGIRKAMGLEIERKYLTGSDAWKVGAVGKPYRQGYIAIQKGRTVRVRIAGEEGYLTIKAAAGGIARTEFEFPIPLADAQTLLDHHCLPYLVEKTRYRIEHAGMIWEVDEFLGLNRGLVVAEVELQSEDQAIALPDWVGAEVTHDVRYLNSALSQHPYSLWASE
jgi:CYTH domain-containing protein